MKTNNSVQKLFLKPRPFATLAIILATTFGMSLSSCNNVSKNTTKNTTKTTTKIETTSKDATGVEIDVIFVSATWYAGSTKYYFKNAKEEQIEISLLNDPMEDGAKYNPKMPKESLLEGDDPQREGPPSENPKFVGKKFKIIYDAKDTEKVVEIRKNF